MQKTRPIVISGFKGMNNITESDAYQGHDDGSMTAIPRVLLNADVQPDNGLKKREGFSLHVALPNAHSAWGARGIMLAVAEGRLYRFFADGTYINLGPVSGPHEERMYYVDVQDKVYLSSRHWMGIVDKATNALSQWGMAVPEQPVITIQSGTGTLQPGIIQVCYTNAQGNVIGGNGMIVEAEISVANSSILLLNKPATAIAWATDPDGHKFYRAALEQNRITELNTVEPLSTFMCSPPNPMRFIRYAFGRMWGAIDNTLVYSEEYRLDLFRTTNVFQFPEEVILVAVVEGGIYVGFESRTIFLPGTKPEDMSERTVGEGVAKNIVAYCNNVPDMGNKIPVWVSKDGLVAGGHSGSVANIVHNRIQFPAGTEGAAIQRTVNGQDQIIASFKQEKPRGSGVGFGDSTTCEVVRNGKVL
jgi:hypothetical protein